VPSYPCSSVASTRDLSLDSDLGVATLRAADRKVACCDLAPSRTSVLFRRRPILSDPFLTSRNGVTNGSREFDELTKGSHSCRDGAIDSTRPLVQRGGFAGKEERLLDRLSQ
jgi:hypothetical protein